MDLATLRQAMQGQEAVLCALGAGGKGGVRAPGGLTGGLLLGVHPGLRGDRCLALGAADGPAAAELDHALVVVGGRAAGAVVDGFAGAQAFPAEGAGQPGLTFLQAFAHGSQRKPGALGGAGKGLVGSPLASSSAL